MLAIYSEPSTAFAFAVVGVLLAALTAILLRLGASPRDSASAPAKRKSSRRRAASSASAGGEREPSSPRPPKKPQESPPACPSFGAIATCKVLIGKWRERCATRVDRVATVLRQQDAACIPLAKEAFVGLGAEAREQMLGERLYACVALLERRRPGKVTGMLLELSDDEILDLLAHGDAAARAAALSTWVDEANGVLDEAAKAELAKAAAHEAQREALWTVVERKTTRGARRRPGAPSPTSVIAHTAVAGAPAA